MNEMTLTPIWQVAGLAALAGALIVAAIWILLQHRESPDKKERRRRLEVNVLGRLADGMVTDAGPNTIYYAYAVAGVEYRTAQDVSHLVDVLPSDPERLIGPVTLKYTPRNPANSIVVCEVWSGLRTNSKETISQ